MASEETGNGRSGADAPLTGILRDLQRTGHGDRVSVGDVVDSFQHRPVGVLLAVFGLISALPVIGAIPGVSILTASLVLLAVGQAVVGGGTPWLPETVRRREIGHDKLDRAAEKSRPWVEKIDRLLKPRLTVLVGSPVMRWIAIAMAALLALTFYPLAFVPWGVTPPSLGVLAIGLGLMASDGVLILLGYVLAAVTVYIGFMAL